MSSVNRYKPHVYVLPEDDRERQIANGFILHPGVQGRIGILIEAGGWRSVAECFLRDHVSGMRAYSGRHMVLLIDFDTHPERAAEIMAQVPPDISGRVFVLGVLDEPEDLKASLQVTYEEIGLRLAGECYDGTSDTWRHPHLRHNAPELDRLRELVYPILFTGASA